MDQAWEVTPFEADLYNGTLAGFAGLAVLLNLYQALFAEKRQVCVGATVVYFPSPYWESTN